MPRSNVVYPSETHRRSRKDEKDAAAARLPNTAPIAKPLNATATVTSVALSMSLPQPASVNPIRSR